MILPICPTCRNTGKVEVSYADPENGPTNDPADESGIEPCECPVGYQVWYHETEANEKTNAAFFNSLLEEAARAYDPYRHDPDSVGFDDSYTGPSERELMGGCNRCGGLDDCYCMDDI